MNEGIEDSLTARRGFVAQEREFLGQTVAFLGRPDLLRNPAGGASNFRTLAVSFIVVAVLALGLGLLARALIKAGGSGSRRIITRTILLILAAVALVELVFVWAPWRQVGRGAASPALHGTAGIVLWEVIFLVLLGAGLVLGRRFLNGGAGILPANEVGRPDAGPTSPRRWFHGGAALLALAFLVLVVVSWNPWRPVLPQLHASTIGVKAWAILCEVVLLALVGLGALWAGQLGAASPAGAGRRVAVLSCCIVLMLALPLVFLRARAEWWQTAQRAQISGIQEKAWIMLRDQARYNYDDYQERLTSLREQVHQWGKNIEDKQAEYEKSRDPALQEDIEKIKADIAATPSEIAAWERERSLWQGVRELSAISGRPGPPPPRLRRACPPKLFSEGGTSRCAGRHPGRDPGLFRELPPAIGGAADKPPGRSRRD